MRRSTLRFPSNDEPSLLNGDQERGLYHGNADSGATELRLEQGIEPALAPQPATRYTAPMTPSEARQLLDYHVWARERAIAAVAALTTEQFLQDLGNSFGSIRDTLAHLYGADEVWLSRWRGGTPRGLPPATQFGDLASLRAAWARLDPDFRAFVHGLDGPGLARTLTYPAFNGQLATLSHEQMLQHVVNHGSYHRGQVTTLLRQLGAAAPKSMDLVAFFRERAS